MGGLAPETRKALREVEDAGMLGLAKRLSTAISREYTMRTTAYSPYSEEWRGYISCTCKLCGCTFKRRPWSYQSRDYCTPTHLRQGERNLAPHPVRRLTWEDVDEIRTLYATGLFSHQKLAEKFCVGHTAICRVVTYQRWNPENDPRSKA